MQSKWANIKKEKSFSITWSDEETESYDTDEDLSNYVASTTFLN